MNKSQNAAKSIDTKDKKHQRILKCFGTWDNDDIKTINEIVEERANFSMNRDVIIDCVEFKNELHKKLYEKSGANNFYEYIKYVNSIYSDNNAYTENNAYNQLEQYAPAPYNKSNYFEEKKS
jgi:hypothetical protein